MRDNETVVRDAGAFKPDAAITRELTPDEVGARFRAARQRGRPDWLWPDVDVAAWRASVAAIARTLMATLSPPKDDVRLDAPHGARAIGIAGYTSGTGPLLGRWIEDGRVQADAEVRDVLAAHLAHARERARRMREALAIALDTLHAEQIPVTVLKSAYTAHFGEPGLRPAADIDLRVPAARMHDAERALERTGHTCVLVTLRPYKSSWRPAGSSRTIRSLELDHGGNPFSIELHSSLDRAFYGVRRVSFRAYEDTYTKPWDIHPAAYRLVHPLHLVFLATHASEELHQLQLIRLVDIALVARAEAARPEDWDAVLRLLRDTDAHRFAYPAFTLVERLLPGTVPAHVSDALERAAPPRMRRVLRALTPATAQRLDGVSLEERFMWAHGPVEIVRRTVSLLWPMRAHRSARTRTALYRERLYRLLRGNVSVRVEEPPDA